MNVTEIRQPMTRPKTVDEFRKARPRMIDTDGAPLVSAQCPTCEQVHLTVEPCRPQCPECGSTAARCMRPSGHEAQDWHAARWAALDRLSDERLAAGLPVVARWADPSPALFDDLEEVTS